MIPNVFNGFVVILDIREHAIAPKPNPNINDDTTNVDAVIVVPPVKDIILNQQTSNIKKQKPAKNAIVAKKIFCFLPILFLFNYCLIVQQSISFFIDYWIINLGYFIKKLK